jgi:NAD(P)-dependent dehydrogenase (short-subunit alcohol dehydrogenase family)
MTSLNGKRVVITGATGALGSAVVTALLERGAECHLPMREAEVPAHLPWRGDARVHPVAEVELDDEAAVTGFYAALPSLWGSVHLVGGFAMKPLLETSLAELRAQHDLNAVTCFLCSREAARAMQRGGGVGGRIVNVTARASVSSAPGMLAYTMAKAAVTSLTQSLAAELLGAGILVNAVSPSLIDSAANRAAMPDADFAKWPKAAEIAEAIAYLVSAENALTSGAIVPVHGRA